MVELTPEEIQELDQHDIEKIWPSDEAVASAASKLNRDWNPFLSGAQISETDSGPELIPDTESQGAYSICDATTSSENISDNAHSSHDHQQVSRDDPFTSQRLQDFMHQPAENSLEKPTTFQPNATPAPSGVKMDDKLPQDRKEAYSGFSMTNNLLDSVTVDSSLVNSVLDSGSTHKPLWGNSLGFGLFPQTNGTGNQSNQSAKGVGDNMPLQDPAIMHVMSSPLSAMPEHQMENDFSALNSSKTAPNGIKQKSSANDQNFTVSVSDYDIRFNPAPFVPFPQESIHGNIDLGSMLPDLADSSSPASTPQQHSSDQDIPQQRCDTSDMHNAESSTRGRNLQGMKRPRCRPTVDVVPAAGEEEHSSSESEGDYEDASDVWDTGSSIVSDKQYTEIEARDYCAPPPPPLAGNLDEVEDSGEYSSSSDVDEGGGSSEYDADPETTRSTQNTPVLQLDGGENANEVPLDRPAGFTGSSGVKLEVAGGNKGGVQVNAVKPTVQPTNPPQGDGAYWPSNSSDSNQPGFPQKPADFTSYFNAYGNPMQFGVQPWMMNMGMPFGMGMPNMGMMAAQMMQAQQNLKQPQNIPGSENCSTASDSQAPCQDSAPTCAGPMPPVGTVPSMQMPNPMAMPNMHIPSPMTSPNMGVPGDPIATFGMGNPVNPSGVNMPNPAMPPFMPNLMSMMMMNPQMMQNFAVGMTGGAPGGGMTTPQQMAPGPVNQPPGGSSGHATDINANDTKEQPNNPKIIHDS